MVQHVSGLKEKQLDVDSGPNDLGFKRAEDSKHIYALNPQSSEDKLGQHGAGFRHFGGGAGILRYCLHDLGCSPRG